MGQHTGQQLEAHLIQLSIVGVRGKIEKHVAVATALVSLQVESAPDRFLANLKSWRDLIEIAVELETSFIRSTIARQVNVARAALSYGDLDE